MYNLLEKLRAGEPFTDKDREYNNKALVSTLKQIHDELDIAVLDAYGWPHDITDEQILENLVALNAERAEEERNGYVRWLRPEYQAPDEVQPEQAYPRQASSKKKNPSSNPSNSKNGPPNPKTSLPPSVTCYAPPLANGPLNKSLPSSKAVTLRKSWMPLTKTWNAWNGLAWSSNVKTATPFTGVMPKL